MAPEAMLKGPARSCNVSALRRDQGGTAAELVNRTRVEELQAHK